jgi:NAD(P)-dependent dehydrogenase (short-subunit alcohol dehydrogenase family)
MSLHLSLPTKRIASFDKHRLNYANIILQERERRTNMTFEGKTIIITGAGGNFGREGCLFFAEKGANVAAFDVNLTLEETLKSVKDKNPDAKIVCKECNVTDASNVQAAVDAVVAEFGSIDLLWNNAGYQGQIKVLLTRWTVLYDYGGERN